MAYIGNEAQTAFTSFDKQTITGNGTATYTLSHSVSNDQEVEVFVNNVRQEGGSGKAYTVSGNQITFSENIASTDDCYVVFQGKAVQTVVPPAGSVTDSMITGLSSSKLTGALPLQVLQTVDTTPVSASPSAGWNDLGTLSVSITPSSVSSKIMIECHIGQFDHSSNTHIFYLKYVRGSTDIGIGAAAGSRIRATTAVRGDVSGDGNATTPVIMPKFLDSPSTISATTYKVQFNNYNGGAYYYLQSNTDSDMGAYGRFIATLTATEIGA